MAASTSAYSQAPNGARSESPLPPSTASLPEVDLDPVILARVQKFSRTASWLVITISGISLLGWGIHSEILKSVLPGHAALKPNTALALLLLAAALRWAQTDSASGRILARLGAVLVAGIGFFTLAEYVFAIDLHIDQLLFRDPIAQVGMVYPGRMAVIAAASFVLLGGGLLVLACAPARASRITNVLALVVFLIALQAAFAHFFAVSGVEGLSLYTDLSLPAAMALLLLSAALLCLQPEIGLMRVLTSQGVGGLMLRRLLPCTLLVPPLLSWLAVEGVKRNLYADRADAALIALSVVAVAASAVTWNAYSLNRVDAARCQAEKALRESRDQWELTFNCMSEGLSYHDPNYTIVAANESFYRLLGREKLAGVQCYKAVHGTEGPPDDCPMQRTLVSGKTESSEFFVPAIGRHVNVRTDPVFDDQGRVTRVVHVVNDVTEKKRAETAIRRLAAIVESTDDAVISKDLEGRIRSWNRAAERMYGYTAAEAIGKPVALFCPPEMQDENDAVLAKILAGQRVVNLETQRLRRDGTPIDVSLTISPLFDTEGAVVGVSTIARDISERKRAEMQERRARREIEGKSAEIARLNAELEERVRVRTAELETSNRELEAFSYSVSHDLRAPLRSIDGFSHILLDEYADKLDADGQHFLNRVRAASQHMGQLIDALLQLSRVTRAGMHRENVDFSALSRKILDALQQTAPTRHLELRVATGLSAMGDPRLLQIALQNLLGNAFKFTSRRERAQIEVGCFEQDGCKVFYVRDNGAGFQMEYAHKLFGAFQRLHAATEFEGTGIGLATVHRIVCRHGGRVWAEGAPDKGATFYFTLP